MHKPRVIEVQPACRVLPPGIEGEPVRRLPVAAALKTPPAPRALHGPYLTWTRKVAGKTVTRRLTEDQYQAYRPWFDASHTLHALVAELEALSLDIIEDELRLRCHATATAGPASCEGIGPRLLES